jgi:RNA polymerase sigma factor (sigma-70 family)
VTAPAFPELKRRETPLSSRNAADSGRWRVRVAAISRSRGRTRLVGMGIAKQRIHPGLLLGVLLIGPFMAQVDVTIVNVATPSVHADLGASGAVLQLVVGGYLIAVAMLLIIGARLGQAYGYRRAFLAGVSVFTLASLACGLAPDPAVLVAARVLQGAGAGVMFPQTLTGIQLHFAGPDRVRAIGRYALALSAGAVSGQILGGLLVSANVAGLGWRAVAAAVEPRYAPDISGASSTLIQIGGAIGVAAIGTLYLAGARDTAPHAIASVADDVFQDTMLAALAGYPRVRKPESVKSWLLRIAARKAIDAIRARAREPVPVPDVRSAATAPGPEPPDEDLWARVRALPPKQRQAVALRTLFDLPYDQIASTMRTSAEAARRNVHEALKTLREEISDEDSGAR